MKHFFSMRSGLNKFIPWLWSAVWFTLPVSMKVNALMLIVFSLAAVVQAIFEKPVIQRKQVILTGLFILFFALHAVSLLFDPARYEVWKSLERKLSFVFIPFLMLLVSGVKWDLGKWAARGFFAGLALTGIHMLSAAILHLAMGRSIESVTYHEFTKPYTLGAIYYSCYLSCALYLLAYRKMEMNIERFSLPLSLFFLVLLLFSASKLFIALTIPAIIWIITKKYFKAQGIKRYVVPIVFLMVVIAGSVPFISRISELRDSDFSVARRAGFAYDTPFNGLTFRMVLWRFAGEIMQDKNAWLTGTGIGSRQEILDGYYRHYGIYTGNPELGDTGYLGYNFHNQYLEVLAGTGIPGLILLLSILVLIFFSDRDKLLFPLIVYVIVLLFFLTESMLERQAGIIFFCLIWTLRVNVPLSIRS